MTFLKCRSMQPLQFFLVIIRYLTQFFINKILNFTDNFLSQNYQHCLHILGGITKGIENELNSDAQKMT